MNDIKKQKRGSDRIVNHFTKLISSRELSPGDKLPSEADLCLQFESSRTVIRESIQQLKAMGLLDTLNGKGSYVSEGRMNYFMASLELYSSRAVTARDWKELLSFRSLLEVECTRLLAKKGDAVQLAPVKMALDVMRANRADFTKFGKADVQFHRAIAKLTDNRILIALLKSLLPLSMRFASQTYPQQGQADKNINEHTLIYEAMLEQRVDDAGNAMAQHLQNAKENLLRMLKQS